MRKAPAFLEVRDVARALGVSVGQTYRLIAAGKLPGTKVAGVIRVPREAWERWLSDQTELALANVAARAGGR